MEYLVIRNNKLNKGICIIDVDLKLPEFADDTTVILNGSHISPSNTLEEIKLFGNMAWLKIYIDKKQLTWIGANKYSSDKMCWIWFCMGLDQVCLLGIDFNVDLHPITNFVCLFVKLKSDIKME